MAKKPSAKTALARRERLLRDLPELDAILRGSLVTRFRRCGKSGCHCAQEGDPGHGPAYYLVTTVAPGETVQIYVPEDHKDQVERFIENFRSARQGLEEISSLNRQLLRQGSLFKGG
jgi:hypothetical protein